MNPKRDPAGNTRSIRRFCRVSSAIDQQERITTRFTIEEQSQGKRHSFPRSRFCIVDTFTRQE